MRSDYLLADSQQTSGPSCCRRIYNCFCSIISWGILFGMLFVAWDRSGRPSWMDIKTMLGQIDPSDFQNVLGNLTDSDWMDGFQEDPNPSDSGELHIWKHNKDDGLVLTLENALNAEWQTEFTNAVSDWQECQALTLSTITVEVDNACQPVEGLMRVCNGNFGSTGWVGINELMMVYSGQTAYIETSVAKMNEFYLQNAAYEKRQYTMCHEIGHGFGLPHTDENFMNENQGNCLDYTTRPESNMHPGDVNFYKLLTMYTNYEANQEQGNYAAAAYQDAAYDQGQYDGNNNDKNNNNKNNNNKNNNNRWLRRRTSETATLMDQGMDEDGTPWKRVMVRHYLWNWNEEEE